MREAQRWRRANRALVAKGIGELAYEELLEPERVDKGRYRLALASGASYAFAARRTPWTWLEVDPSSLQREGEAPVEAAGFLLEAQAELGIDDLALGELLHEVTNTLYSEVRRLTRLDAVDAGQLVEMSGARQETFLDGHPKFLANKGRVGWGRSALARYAPESGNAFELRYLAVRTSRCSRTVAPHRSPEELGAQCLDERNRERLETRMVEAGVDPEAYVFVPVHPWQHERYLSTQFAGAFAEDTLVDLGELGDTYLPQQSIRTLSNVDRPGRADVKLSLTILNTSCYRGIPGEHLDAGVELSAWLSELAQEDPVLAERDLLVLRQLGAVHVPHPHQARLAEGPYRFQEMLGAVWRENPQAATGPSEQAILLSTLMQTDAEGRALVTEYVERSELGPEAWLRELFDAVTVPLYHLMAKHGIGLVAHGQNVGLVLREDRPERGIVKDVHGDLRLVDEPLPELDALPPATADAVKRLPPEHLLQDLFTGHLVTTLRFISPLVEAQLGVPETRFYSLLARRLEAYQDSRPELEDRFAMFDIFQDPIDKVLVNRVRLRSGFGQDAQRPEPTFGTPIPNPLAGGRR